MANQLNDKDWSRVYAWAESTKQAIISRVLKFKELHAAADEKSIYRALGQQAKLTPDTAGFIAEQAKFIEASAAAAFPDDSPVRAHAVKALANILKPE